MSENDKHLLVGIAGPTCTYKTSLLGELRGRFEPPATTLSFDEYDLYPSGSTAMDQELAEPTITNWEDPKLFDEAAYISDLDLLSHGLAVVLKTRSRESLALAETSRVIQPSKLTIVEGVFTFRHEHARSLFSLTAYIDLPTAVMVSRRLARSAGGSDPWDQPDYIRGAMVAGTERYILPQRRQADIVIDGLLAPTAQADIMADYIMRTLH